MWENISSLGAILSDSAKHFLFSGLAGLLVYYVTWITYYALIKLFPRANWLRSMAVNQGIHFLSLLLVLAFSLGSHFLLDKFTEWYNTPLAPPMTIEK